MYNGVYTIEQYAYMHDTLMKWLKNKINGKSLGQRLLEMDISKVAIYGANELGKMVYNDIKESDVRVECFVDKNADKYSSSAEEIPVIKPSEISLLEKESYVLITPEYYFYEILTDLREKGITAGKNHFTCDDCLICIQ